jgi:hypothetical protein
MKMTRTQRLIIKVTFQKGKKMDKEFIHGAKTFQSIMEHSKMGN